MAITSPLLYVSSYYGVYVYSYPAGLFVGELSGVLGPEPPCADRAGHVFIPDIGSDTIDEYAHGSAESMDVIPGESGATPVGCTVDVVTGDLIVANANAPGRGDIAIYPPKMTMAASGWGSPTIVHDPIIVDVSSCTSDAAGNVFISGTTSLLAWRISELLRGHKQFTTIRAPTKIQQYRDIRWDGTDLAVVGNSNNMHRLRITGTRATIVGVAHLHGAYGMGGFSFFPDSDGPPRRVIVPDIEGGNVGYWRYPAGGQPQKFIPNIQNALGTVISMPANH